MSDMDPDLLLAIALSESLMVRGGNGGEDSNSSPSKPGEDNNGGGGGNDDNDVIVPDATQPIDKIYEYFVELVKQLRQEKIDDLTPLYSILKLSLQSTHIHYVTKVIEFISFLIIDGKYGSLDINKIYSFSKSSIEFCLNTLEKWGDKELNIDSSSNETKTPLVLLSIIDMLCCIEFPSTIVDKQSLDSIPNFTSLVDFEKFTANVVSKKDDQEKKEEKKVDEKLEEQDIFDQFLNNGLGKKVGDTTTNTSTTNSSSIIDQDLLNEEMLKNNTSYFTKTLGGTSRLLAICSKLLPTFVPGAVSKEFDDFHAREDIVSDFIGNVQDILFSEGFEQFDAASIPWTIDLLMKLIDTLRSYQSFNIRLLTTKEDKEDDKDKEKEKNNRGLIKSKLLSNQVFENLFRVLGTKMNCPDIQFKAEIFFSICILNDIEMMNLKIQDIMIKDRKVEREYISWSPQLVIMAINLVFDHLESINLQDDGDHSMTPMINRSMMTIPLTTTDTSNKIIPQTKFLIANIGWFDFLSTKQYTSQELTSMFITPRLLDSIFSILYISYFKLKDNPHILIEQQNSNNSNNNSKNNSNNSNNNNNVTPLKSSLSMSSSSVGGAPIKSTKYSADTSGDEGSLFGSLFHDDGPSQPLNINVVSSPLASSSGPGDNSSSSGKIDVFSAPEGSYQSFISFVNKLFERPQSLALKQAGLSPIHLQVLSTILYYQSDSYIPSKSLTLLIHSICLSFIKPQKVDILTKELEESWINITFDMIKDHDLELEKKPLLHLSPPKELLVLLGWLFVRRQKQKNQIDDSIVVRLWNRFLLFQAPTISIFSTDINHDPVNSVEYLYFLMFSYHTLTPSHRLEIIKQSYQIIHQVGNNKNLPNSLLFSRFLFIFNYIIYNFEKLESRISKLFYDNVLIGHSDQEEFTLSLVNINYKNLIDQIKLNNSSSSSNNNTFYEFNFNSNAVNGNSSFSTLNLEQYTQLFNKCSIDYEVFYKDIVSLCTMVEPININNNNKNDNNDKQIESLLLDYIITSSCSLLRSIPTSSNFIKNIKDKSLFLNINQESIIYLTFLHSTLIHDSNKECVDDIPWNNHTQNIINNLPKLLADGQKHSRIYGIVQSALAYLKMVFDKQGDNLRGSTSGSSSLTKSEDLYMEGWKSLFDDEEDEDSSDEDEEDDEDEDMDSDSESHDEDSSQDQNNINNNSKKDDPQPTTTSASTPPPPTQLESKVSILEKESLIEMIPSLFESLIVLFKYVKEQYRSKLLSLVSMKHMDRVQLVCECFANNCSKSDILVLMDKLEFSKEDRLIVEKVWGVEIKLNITSVPKYQRGSLGWLLHPIILDTDTTLSIQSHQLILRSLTELTELSFNVQKSKKIVVEEKEKENQPSPMLIDSVVNVGGGKSIESLKMEITFERAEMSVDRLLVYNKDSQFLESDSQKLSYLLSTAKIASFERICRLVSQQSYEVQSSPVVETIVLSNLDHIIATAKSHPDHIYCHYIEASRSTLKPMGSAEFDIPLPKGDITQLVNFTMDSEKIDRKALLVLIQLLSLPIQQQQGGEKPFESLRSFIIKSISSIQLEKLVKWFEQKLLGRKKSNDSMQTDTDQHKSTTSIDQPSNGETQELVVKLIGLLIGGNDLANYSNEIDKSTTNNNNKVEDDEEEEEDEEKKKKSKKQKYKNNEKKSTPIPIPPPPPPTPASTLVNWDESVQDITPLIYDVLLASFQRAFTEWIDQPNLLKVYFGLLQYLALKQHRLVELFEEVSKFSGEILINPSQLESLDLLVEFIENFLVLLGPKSQEKDSSMLIEKDDGHHHNHCHKDQDMTDSSNHILLDDDEEEEDDDESGGNNQQPLQPQQQWKKDDSSPSSSAIDEDNEVSEARRLANKLCTYTASKNDYIDQHWYFCYTCGLKTSEGCCSTCVKVCHKGHVVSYSRFSRFFCDCGAGAGKGGPCKALKPRSFQPPKKDSPQQPSKDSPSTPNKEKVIIDQQPQQPQSSLSSLEPNSLFYGELSTEQVEKIVKEMQQKAIVIERIAELYPKLLANYKGSSDKSVTQQQVSTNYQVYAVPKKELSSRTDLIVQKKTTKNGVFECKTRYESGTEGNQLKNLVNAGLIQRRTLASNSRGVVAVAEGENVSLINVAKMLDEESTVDRASLKSLCKSAVGFPVMSMSFNPMNDSYLAVAGARECKILTVNSKDEIVDQLVIDLSLYSIGENIYIIKVEWVVGSQVELAVVTNEFVKIYDLSTDNLSPSHFYTLVEDSIRDVCTVQRNQQVYMLVLAESGMLYTQAIQPSIDDESCIMIETVQLPTAKQSPGVCLYSAPDLAGVFVTFTNGEAYLVQFNDTLSSLTSSIAILDPNLKLAMPSCYFTTLSPNYANIVTCLASRGGFLVTLKFTSTAELQIQTIKMSTKVEGITWVNKASPKLLVLFEDGSLTRYDYTIDSPLSTTPLNNNNNLNVVPSNNSISIVESNIDILSMIKKQKNRSSTNLASSPSTTNQIITLVTKKEPTFPIDYFEKVECITSSCKFGGDPLQSYSQDLIKQRLSNNDEYIVCQSLEAMSLIVYNNNAESVISGIRVLVGNASLKHIPTELRIFDRIISTTEGLRRWYDIPLSNEEAIKAAKKLTIVAAPTYNSGNAPIIDSVEVYASTKESVGYDEVDNASGGGSANNKSGSSTGSLESLNSMETVLLRTMSCLSLYFASVGGDNVLREKTIKQLAQAMTDPQLAFLHSAVKDLLKILLASEEEYLELKHTTLLAYANQSITKMIKEGVSDNGERLEHVIMVLKKISASRPNNLVTHLFAQSPSFLVDLMNIYRTASSGGGAVACCLSSEEVVGNLCSLLGNCLYNRAFSSSYIFGLLKPLLSHSQDSIRTRSALALVTLISKSPAERPPVLPSKTIDIVHFSCDKCRVYPIQNKRWHCEMCGDFDLCNKCYLEITSTKEHPQDHKFTEHLLDEQMTDSNSSGGGGEKMVQDNNTEEHETSYGDDLQKAIAMSLGIEEENKVQEKQQEEGEEEEDPFINFFKLLVDEMFSIYDKGFGVVLPYAQVVLSLFTHLGDKLSNNQVLEQFVGLVSKQLSKYNHSTIEKYLTSKSTSLEGDTIIFILLSLLLDTDVHKHQNSQNHQNNNNNSKSSSSSCTTISQTMIYKIGEMFYSKGFVEVLRNWMSSVYQVISSQVNYNSPEASSMASPFGALLVNSQSDDQSLSKHRFAPFFSKSLPSSPSSIQQILAKNIFKLAITFYRCDRRTRKLTPSSKSWFSPANDWMSLTCSYIHSKKTSSFAKYPKKLLLLLAVTKSSYYAVRDEFLLKKKYAKIQDMERQSNGFTDDIHYDHLIKLIGYLTSMLEVASTRPHSWQYFCFNNDVLKGLFNNLFFLPEESSPLILELLTFAFVKDESIEKVDDPSKDTIMKDSNDNSNISMFLQGNSMDILINNLLLEPNSSDLRQNTSNFLYNLWKSSNIDQKIHINKCLWSKLDQVVSYGKNSTEFMELLTFVLNEIDPNKWKHQFNEFSDKFIESFKSQNQCINNHPNSQIYTSLGSVLELDGYFLESEPCLVCNNPEVQYQTLRLDSLKQEYKFTDSCQLIKFNGVYSIQKLNIQIHDSKKARMIKTINLFYNNKTISDIGELKGKFTQWKKLKQIHFAPNQTEKSIRFQIPIAAANFMIEYFDFHDNLQALSSEKLQCPRCSRTVTDKHGICKHCHENAFQCKQCRNINYENLEGFLCNECGFCKHARFDYQFTCKPTVSIEKIENQEDHKRAIATIDKESENAHKKYQRLIGFKRVICSIITSFQTQEASDKDDLFTSVASQFGVPGGNNQQQSQQQQQQQQQQQPSSTSTSTSTSSNSHTFSSLRINPKIGYLAKLYEKDCKMIFEGLSKSVQILLSTRMEIINYMNVLAKKPRVKETKSRASNNCFGCSNAYTEQSLLFLNHLSRNPHLVELRTMLIQKGLTKELFKNNIHHGKSQSRNNARLAISYLTKNSLHATSDLNEWIKEKIEYAMNNYSSLDLPTMISSEMVLLRECSTLADSIWQTRFRFVMEIFFKAIEQGSNNPVISEYIILPCLKIILSLCTIDRSESMLQKDLHDTEDNQKTLASKFEKLKNLISTRDSSPASIAAATTTAATSPPTVTSPTDSTTTKQYNYFDQADSNVKFDEWLNSDTFDQWANRYQQTIFNSPPPPAAAVATPSSATSPSMGIDKDQYKKEIRNRYLMTKYISKWRSFIKKSSSKNATTTNPLDGLFEDNWVKKLLFNSTASIRSETINLMNILSRSSPVRTLRFLDLFEKMIPYAAKVGENSAEFFALFNKIIAADERKIYLTVRGFLPYLCDLIIKDIERINSLESSFNTDVSQGYVLMTLVTMLMSFMEVPSIKLKMKRDNLIEKVLDAFLSLRGVITQKNKLTEDSVRQLQELMKSLNSESVEDNKKFMAANIKALEKHRHNGRTPIFIFEQLCNIVCPVKPDPVHMLVLVKASTQEEYIRGSMKNPYASNTIGPLMRDIKNKICKTLDLGTFLEDDNGMELLVDNKIIKLDLPIKRVYEQVWKRSSAAQRSQDANIPMTVVYRLQGLDGEATEEIIENLNDDNGEERNPEEEFEITSIFAQCGGLQAMLSMIEGINDFSSEKELGQLVIKLLFHSSKIIINREQLITLNGVGRLLEKLKQAFHQPDLAESLLLIIESIVTEANRSYLTNSNSSTSHIAQDLHHKTIHEAQDQMSMFLDKLTSPLVRNNTRIIQAMTRVIPFLTYGHAEVINSLIDFFMPYLEFEEYDAGGDKRDANITAHLDFFTKIADFTRPDDNGYKLRSLVLERGITGKLYDYIDKCLPEAKDKSSTEWTEALERAALPYVLILLKGLANGHEPTQKMAVERNVIKRLHLMEQTSTTSAKNVGSLAENLLESLQVNNDQMTEEIARIRNESKKEKLLQAEKHRQGVLKELGLAQQGKHITSQVVPGIIDDLEEEEGFTCMVCREGYSFKPNDVLGIYTFSKRIPLLAINETTVTPSTPGGERREREPVSNSSSGFTTVTHFNIIHYFCHRDATKADKSMKVPKEEWEGAALRNQQTKCNNIFPIQGPRITNDAFSPYSDKYWTNLNNMSRIDANNPRFRILAHDLKLLLIRFAKDESFSSDSKGGGKDSNIRIVPFFVQFGNFLLDQKIVGTAANQLRRPHFEKTFNQFMALTLESSITNSSIEADNIPYYLVLSLFLQSYKDWKSTRFNLLMRLVAYAFVEKSNNNNNNGSTFSILRPWLLFFTLIDKFHEIINPTNQGTNTTTTTSTTTMSTSPTNSSIQSTNVDNLWISETKSYLSSHYTKVQQDCKTFLASFEEEFSVFEEESEFFDELGLLKDVLNQDKDCKTFISNILSIVKQQKK